LVNSQRKILGPRKQNGKTEEIIPKRKSVLNYHSSDSDDTMRSNIPIKLDVDHNNIMKLKQRILVWAGQQSGYDANDVSANLFLKNLNKIYSDNYRELSSVSIEEARQVNLPHWITARLRDNSTNITIQRENTKNIQSMDNNPSKGTPLKDNTYRIVRKKNGITKNTKKLPTSHDWNYTNRQASLNKN
jgi:hypothetical protein